MQANDIVLLQCPTPDAASLRKNEEALTLGQSTAAGCVCIARLKSHLQDARASYRVAAPAAPQQRNVRSPCNTVTYVKVAQIYLSTQMFSGRSRRLLALPVSGVPVRAHHGAGRKHQSSRIQSSMLHPSCTLRGHSPCTGLCTDLNTPDWLASHCVDSQRNSIQYGSSCHADCHRAWRRTSMQISLLSRIYGCFRELRASLQDGLGAEATQTACTNAAASAVMTCSRRKN